MKKIKAIFAVWLILAAVIYLLHGSKAAAAMFIVAAVYCIISAVMVYVCGKKLKVELGGDPAADKDKPAEVKVTSSNGSRLPVPACTIGVSCRNVLTHEEQEMSLLHSCAPMSDKASSFTLTSRYCGMEEIRADEVTISDPAGLFQRRQRVGASARVFVMPEIKEVEIPGEYMDSYDMESYSYSQHIKGTDTGEVFGIREYAEGDSLKQVHWKLSAKMGDMMVKIPSYPIENKLVVLLDNSIADGTELTAEMRSGLMEFFFSVSSSLLKKNIAHSLGWCDHSTGAFILKRVENESDMWSAVTEALAGGMETSMLTTVYRFLESSEEHFTNHFIVTATGASETERLMEYGQVHEFMYRPDLGDADEMPPEDVTLSGIEASKDTEKTA